MIWDALVKGGILYEHRVRRRWKEKEKENKECLATLLADEVDDHAAAGLLDLIMRRASNLTGCIAPGDAQLLKIPLCSEELTKVLIDAGVLGEGERVLFVPSFENVEKTLRAMA